MFVITHGLSPVLIAGTGEALRRRAGNPPVLGRRELIAIGVSGALPDCLTPHLSLASRLSSFSHTLWFAALFSIAALILARWLSPRRPILVGSLMAAAVWWHLFCDFIAGGIAPMWPFATASYGTYLVSPALWLPLDILCLACVALLARHLSKHASQDT